jgi:hypothetical protein
VGKWASWHKKHKTKPLPDGGARGQKRRRGREIERVLSQKGLSCDPSLPRAHTARFPLRLPIVPTLPCSGPRWRVHEPGVRCRCGNSFGHYPPPSWDTSRLPLGSCSMVRNLGAIVTPHPETRDGTKLSLDERRNKLKQGPLGSGFKGDVLLLLLASASRVRFGTLGRGTPKVSRAKCDHRTDGSRVGTRPDLFGPWPARTPEQRMAFRSGRPGITVYRGDAAHLSVVPDTKKKSARLLQHEAPWVS